MSLGLFLLFYYSNKQFVKVKMVFGFIFFSFFDLLETLDYFFSNIFQNLFFTHEFHFDLFCLFWCVITDHNLCSDDNRSAASNIYTRKMRFDFNERRRRWQQRANIKHNVLVSNYMFIGVYYSSMIFCRINFVSNHQIRYIPYGKNVAKSNKTK